MKTLKPTLSNKLASAFFLFFLACIYTVTIGQTKSIQKLDGSTISIAEVDQTVKHIMDAAQVQGLELAILNNNKIAYVQAYGFRNKPQNALADTSTIVYAASFSKAVFGYLVMKLVEEKIIDLDRPLYRYLKKPIADYPYFADLKIDERWKLITARMCLSHTSGLPNVRIFDPITSEMDTLRPMKIYFTPGSKYAYSGEGFKFLQMVIEDITHKSMEQLAQEKIFEPLGMTRTGYTWHESFGDDNVAVGHMNNGSIDKKRKRTVPVAGGSLVTTIADYAKFIQHVMQQKGLRKKMYDEMLTPQIAIHSRTQFPPITSETTTENDAIHLSYGLGWGLLDCGNYGKAFFKEGNGGPWRNYNINFKDKGTSIIIMTNSDNGEALFQELIEKLVGNTCIPWKWQGYVPYNSAVKTN
ncbi:serine hydrolase [Mucilaginibacter sp. SG564]|uniref:serine hydrolase domain-containing protein n=1 Tax=Mucilaginibacter sp. SG564 TaxID=2587022 RepID=UPI00155664D2|nr:serine hydrolase domain-containing protein [Mucilaginibacter sp. SG564]NOW96890.1 CubicO group peptidase (beta-lactamase class C family) [Mucilaginibacter sp. SG564]